MLSLPVQVVRSLVCLRPGLPPLNMLEVVEIVVHALSVDQLGDWALGIACVYSPHDLSASFLICNVELAPTLTSLLLRLDAGR